MSNKKNAFILGSAISFAGLASLWYGRGLVAESHSRERMEAIAEAEREIGEYLESVPALVVEVSDRLNLQQHELSEMQRRLGENCLNAMLDQAEPATFDEALEDPLCSEYSATQLEQARKFYVVIEGEVSRLQDVREVLSDDPKDLSEPIDILEKYSGQIDETVENTNVGTPSITSPIPDSTKIVKPSGDSYFVSNIENPALIKQEEASGWFVVGMIFAGIGALANLANLVADSVLRKSISIKNKYNSLKEYRKDIRSLREMDDDNLGLAVNGLAAQIKDEE